MQYSLMMPFRSVPSTSQPLGRQPDLPQRHHWLLCLVVISLAPGLTACNRSSPKGQVVATVNGEEITLAELNEEARARGITVGNDVSLRNQLLADIIDRKLLLQKALELKLDETPVHLLAKRRTAEILLAQQLIAVTQGARQMAAEPGVQQSGSRFEEGGRSGRLTISVDRISFPGTLPAALAAEVERANRIDAVSDLLDQSGVEAERSLEVLDSSINHPALIARMSAAKPGQIIRYPEGDRIVAARVLAIVRHPLSPRERAQVELGRQRTRQAGRVIEDLLEEGRRRARIDYQEGFRPASGSEPSPGTR